MANRFAVAGTGSQFNAPGAEPAGFWAGLWHGMIMPMTFFVSLFNPDVRIYETHNTGKGYDLGFVMGASMAFGGGKHVQVQVNGKHNTSEWESASELEDEA